MSIMGTYDNGVACMADNGCSFGIGKDYVGELKDILVLDYCKLNTPIILFWCEWKKQRNEEILRI